MYYSRKKLTESIFAAISGTADDEQRRSVELWIAESEENARLYRKLLNPDYRNAAIMEFYDYDPAADWYIVVSRRASRRRRKITRRFLSYASVLILLVAVLVAALHNDTPSEPIYAAAVIEPGTSRAVLSVTEGRSFELVGDTLNYHVMPADTGEVQLKTAAAVAPTIYHTLTVPRGGEFFVRLPDGTNVWLNSESAIRYCVTDGQPQRRVWLEGEAYFEVEKDERPFEVVVAAGVVGVYGTSFNVKAGKETESSHVTLVSGSVDMRSGGKRITLMPGEQALVHPSGEMVKRRVNVMEYTGWKEGIYVFRNRKLRDIMQELSHWYDFSVEFRPEGLGDMTYSGNLKRYDSINIFMDILRHTGDINYHIEDKTIIIY